MRTSDVADWAVREGAKGRPWKEFFAELLQSLLENDLVQFGELAAGGFSPWTGEAGEVVQAIVGLATAGTPTPGSAGR